MIFNRKPMRFGVGQDETFFMFPRKTGISYDSLRPMSLVFNDGHNRNFKIIIF